MTSATHQSAQAALAQTQSQYGQYGNYGKGGFGGGSNAAVAGFIAGSLLSSLYNGGSVLGYGGLGGTTIVMNGPAALGTPP